MSAHGTQWRYRCGCRCEACRQAVSAYKLRYSEPRREQIREKDRAYYQRERETRLAVVNAYRVENSDKRNVQHRLYRAVLAVVNAYRVENSDKRNVQHRLYRAVKAGKVQRPDTCERCGKVGHRIEAHHEDYAKPLEVRWLCTSCHRNHHLLRDVAR